MVSHWSATIVSVNIPGTDGEGKEKRKRRKGLQ